MSKLEVSGEGELAVLEASNLRQLQLLDKMALAHPEIASQVGEIVEDQKHVAQSLQNIKVIQDLFITYTQAVAPQSSPSLSNDTESRLNDTVELFPGTVQNKNYITRESIIETFLKAKEEASFKSEREVFISQSPCNLQKSKLVVVKTEYTSKREHIVNLEPCVISQDEDRPPSNKMPSTVPPPQHIGKRTIYHHDYIMFYRSLFKVWPVVLVDPIADVSLKNAKSPNEYARRDCGKTGGYGRDDRRDDRDEKRGSFSSQRGSDRSGPKRLDQRDEREMRGSRDNKYESRDSKTSFGSDKNAFGGDSKSTFGRDSKRPSYKEDQVEILNALVPGENAWQPKSLTKNKEQLSAAEAAMNKISRSTTAILNKLTPEHFTVLTKQLISLPISNLELLEKVINQIFNRALTEPIYGYMYAVLCKTFNEHLVTEHTWLVELAATDPAYKASSVFRKCMLAKCQSEFEKGSKWASKDKACMEKLRNPGLTLEEKTELVTELEARQRESKLRSLDNLKFSGELYNQTMIPDTIMHRCIWYLCEQEPLKEEQLETLCKLMTTIGEKLDKPASKLQMDSYFLFIAKHSKEKTLDSRIRFMLLDLIELRVSKWVSRTEDKGPTTLAQIRQEALNERKTNRPEACDQTKPAAPERKRLVLLNRR